MGIELFAAAVLALSTPLAWAENHVVEIDAASGRMVNLRTVYPAVGDTVTLPAADEGCEYRIGNPCIAEMIDDNTMRILAPGATSVAYYTGTTVATWNDCAEVVVPPTARGAGKVYVWTRTANDGSGSWTTPGDWYCVTSGTAGDGYPNAVDDVAMVFLNGQRKWLQISVPSDVTVGALWIGQVRHQYSTGDFVERWVGPGAINFEASGSAPAEFHLLGSSTDGKVHAHVLGYSSSNRLKLNAVSSIVADLGFRAGDRVSSSVEFLKFDNVDVTIPEGKSLLFRNIHNGNRGAALHSIDFTAHAKVIGAGTIVNRSAATVGRGGDWMDYTGTYREEGSDHQGYNDNNGNLYLTTPGNPAAQLVVRGFPQIATTSGGNWFRGSVTSWGNFAGFVRVGGAAAENQGNRLNFAELTLQGGFLDLSVDAKADWADTSLVAAPSKLTVAEGFNSIRVHRQSNEAYPTNILDLADLSHVDGAMLSIREPMSELGVNSIESARGCVRVGNFADQAIGGTGEIAAGASDFKILPWLISARTGSTDDCRFFGANSEGVLQTALDFNAHGLDSFGEFDNAVLSGSKLTFSGSEKTVNSLWVRNFGATGNGIAPDTRLTVTSGGVILSFQGIIGTIGSSGEEAGELYFPNRAYIWDVSVDDKAWKHAQIWDRVVAPKGVSFAGVNHAGARLYLGGDQRGIEGDVTINCGTLFLGADGYVSDYTEVKGGCRLRDGLEVRVIGATSTLEIPAPSAKSLRNATVVLRDVAGYPAKISVPAGVKALVRNVIVRDDEGRDTLLDPGVYAAADGEGVDYVDEHIVGEGIVIVPQRGFSIYIR